MRLALKISPGLAKNELVANPEKQTWVDLFDIYKSLVPADSFIHPFLFGKLTEGARWNRSRKELQEIRISQCLDCRACEKKKNTVVFSVHSQGNTGEIVKHFVNSLGIPGPVIYYQNPEKGYWMIECRNPDHPKHVMALPLGYNAFDFVYRPPLSYWEKDWKFKPGSYLVEAR